VSTPLSRKSQRPFSQRPLLLSEHLRDALFRRANTDEVCTTDEVVYMSCFIDHCVEDSECTGRHTGSDDAIR